jgi:hypothetical protein
MLAMENIMTRKKTKLNQWLMHVACCMLHVATKVEGKKLPSLRHPFDTQIYEAMHNAVSQRCPKNQGVCWIQWPAISICFGCWAAHTRSYTMHKGFIQAMWNGDVTAARIIQETK